MEFLRKRRMAKLAATIAYNTAFADDYEKQLTQIGRASKEDLQTISKFRAKAAEAQSALNSLKDQTK